MPMSEKLSPEFSPSQSYYKIQIKAWTDFDPSSLDLKQIAENIDRGHGSLSAIEVVKVVQSLAGVDDDEVRERFETLQAVDRVMQNTAAIPKALLEKLLDQLISVDDDTIKKKAV